jgi:Spy/CpxP family protein refolding chaperone
MNRIVAFAIAAAMLSALPATQSAFAQQSEAPAAPAHSLPSVDDHVRLLAQKLDLTAEQQEKAKPIIQEMQDGIQKVLDDKSLTHEESTARMHSVHMKADKQIREFLTDDQKKKLDDLELHSHPGMHGNSPASPQN